MGEHQCYQKKNFTFLENSSIPISCIENFVKKFRGHFFYIVLITLRRPSVMFWDYQAREWKSWHHHHSLVMLALLFVMKQKMENQEQIPLLSFRDTRILIIMQVFGIDIKKEKRKLQQLDKKHKKRKRDIKLSCEKQRRKKANLTS